MYFPWPPFEVALWIATYCLLFIHRFSSVDPPPKKITHLEALVNIILMFMKMTVPNFCLLYFFTATTSELFARIQIVFNNNLYNILLLIYFSYHDRFFRAFSSVVRKMPG
jgi:hypothetical protein